MSHFRSSPIAIILRKVFSLVGGDYNYYRQRLGIEQRKIEKVLRTLAETLGIDGWSKPALFDIDNKLQKYLSYSHGFFIEVGANNGFDQSNTYYLEKFRQWKGLLIEPIPELYQKCVKERPHCHVINCALVDPDYKETSVKMQYVGLMSMISGLFKETEQKRIEEGTKVQGGLLCYEIEVPVRTLTSILDEYGILEIDFLSLDVEGFELNVLRGLDLKKYRPKYLLIETKSRPLVDEYLKDYYVEVEKLTFHDYLYCRREKT